MVKSSFRSFKVHLAGLGRNRTDNTPGHDETESVDGIARIRHKDDITRRCDRLGHVGKSLFRTQCRDNLGVRVQLHAEPAGVIFSLGLTQTGDATGR